MTKFEARAAREAPFLPSTRVAMYAALDMLERAMALLERVSYIGRESESDAEWRARLEETVLLLAEWRAYGPVGAARDRLHI